MAKTMTFLFLVLALVTLNSTWPFWSAGAAEVTSASMLQFLDRHNGEGDHSWSHLLPTNYYSEMNQQYYRRFRRQAGRMDTFGSEKRQQYPFEYARYV
ncbi:uncharacterized protein LOC6613546 [Drosophila sechellia]|uniref:GM17985 n=1 Tax=Drosophila sechellia TaxID=7238 RepID=B4I1M5_DROSE|nr:uncharacterized protein LOC6613546 [Drosophila sechellia]EDW54432.1 GM17985 [Drosophila sechellia]